MADDNSNRHVFPNLEIREKLEKMLNNEKFSDTVFHVNNSQFHASSHLVSVSSNVLESMLDDHYNNCGDRDIKIGNVKQGASFSIILRYLYGLEIDFEDMTRDVLCEVLGLAERFDLNNFYKELKTYISKLDCFQIDSTVVLLNTAKKYDIAELYEKVKTFAFDNTDALVKDESFVELQYDVLRDLVKSDWLCTSEIDILRGVLKWHSENLKKESNNDATPLVIEDDENQTGEVKEHCEAEDIKEGDTITANENCTQLVKTFSENILKTLLCHIRVKQISLDDYIGLLKTELFMNYDLLDSKQFSQVDEPRKKRGVNNDFCEAVRETISYMDLNNKHILTMACHKYRSLSYSNDIDLKDMKFCVFLKDTICANQYLPFNCEGDVRKVDIYLQCKSKILDKWECIVECKFKILKPELCFYGILIPKHTPLIPVKFTSKKNEIIGEFYYPTSYHDYQKHGTQEFKIEVFFESIKLNERAK